LVSNGIPPGQINSSVLTTDPSLVVTGKTSARIGWYGKLVTVPTVLPLTGSATYIVEFQYRILNSGTDADILHLDLQPDGTTDPQLQVNFEHLGKGGTATGTFSAGGLLPGPANYFLTISCETQTDIVIDNLAFYRQDAVTSSTLPPTWARLETLPFPRLGKYQGEVTAGYAAVAPPGSPYTPDFIDNTMAFFDLAFGVPVDAQTTFPDSIRRARLLNPNAVILPYRLAEEQSTGLGKPTNSNVSLDFQFLNSVSPQWSLLDTKGKPIFEQDYPDIVVMNLSPSTPLVNGNTFLTLVESWLNAKIFPSGVWDGIYFDNLYGDINTHIPNYSNPALIDVDVDRDGSRSSPAAVSNMARSGATALLKQLRQTNGDRQLILANVGSPGLDPYVNGFLHECVNYLWNSTGTMSFSPMSWRAAFDAYRGYEATTRRPRTNALEGCGPIYGFPGTASQLYALPTAADIASHRFTMSTALLSDGFYAFDLHGSTSPPLWYDEYSVDSTGTAAQDLTKKGYLGQALSDAMELTNPGAVLLQESFEGNALPAFFTGGAAPGVTVAISQDPGEVISGSGSLVLSNPNHAAQGGVGVSTDPKVLQFAAGSSYLLTFAWRIIETVDTFLGAAISIDPNQPLDVYAAPGKLAGDHGTASLPFTIPTAGPWSIAIYIVNGGKVAIDNLRIAQNGAGPWRRDFENGFVLVNPFNQPHNFSAADLAGSLGRAAIHRIKGTQAPDVNSGQPVTGPLTLGPFDAIILLSDHKNAPPISEARPAIRPNGVVSAGAFGGFSSISPGSWIEIYGSNLSVTNRGWTGADFDGGLAPTSLDGVSVLIGGRPAFIDYVSPSQINALVASDAAIGPMQVVVSGPTGVSDAYPIAIQPTQPGLLAPPSFQVSGKQYVAALFSDAQTFVLPVGAIPGVSSRPAKPGETITLYGVGFGPVTPNVLAGTLVTASNALANSLQIFIGNTLATTSYAGLAPNLTGLYQFNVTVPSVSDNPAVPLTFNLGGLPAAQTLYIAVQH
jgi:uncharacterized protein (TIGR03437 family)